MTDSKSTLDDEVDEEPTGFKLLRVPLSRIEQTDNDRRTGQAYVIRSPASAVCLGPFEVAGDGETASLRIQCGGSVDLDGGFVGALSREAYDELAHLVPDGNGFEMGDPLTFELRLAAIKGHPVA